MQFLFRSLPKTQHRHSCSLVDFAAIKVVKDRGLDHAVEREKHLKPVLSIKNLIKSEPSKSITISVITQQKDALKIPIRPIELIRRYPSIFQEFLPGGIGMHPRIKLTRQVLDLDREEQLVYQSENYKNDVANRLLKLLMISRIDKIPLKILDILLWDLGLPQDYVKSIVPEFPEYFRVIGNKGLSSGSGSNLVLELVCWSDESAVSVMEKKVKAKETGYVKGTPIEFPMQFSKSFEMDMKLKQWFSEWQKLPYFSPYENAVHLGPSTDESDRWTVGVLHELLNLFVSKKVDRDNLLCLGECLGIRSRLKRALLRHPGIFYLSSKIGTYTVVLKEGYKRGLLIERNPIVDIRNQYIHLMHTVVEEHKSIGVPGESRHQEKKTDAHSEGQGNEEDAKDNVEVKGVRSDLENHSKYEYEDDVDDDEEEEEECEDRTHVHSNIPTSRGIADKNKNLNVRGNSRNARKERGIEKLHVKTSYKAVPKGDYEYDDDGEVEEEEEGEINTHGSRITPRGRADRSKKFDVRGNQRNARRERGIEKHRGKSRHKFVLKNDEYDDADGEEGEGRRHAHRNSPSNRRRGDENKNLDLRGHSRNAGREKGIGKQCGKKNSKILPEDSSKKEVSRGHNFHGSSQERSTPPKRNEISSTAERSAA